jgi:hypothetical protein
MVDACRIRVYISLDFVPKANVKNVSDRERSRQSLSLFINQNFTYEISYQYC